MTDLREKMQAASYALKQDQARVIQAVDTALAAADKRIAALERERDELVTIASANQDELDRLHRRLEAADEIAELLKDSLKVGPRDPRFAEDIERLCNGHSFGAVLHEAARQWVAKNDGGAFTLGHCRSVVKNALKRWAAARGEGGS